MTDFRILAQMSSDALLAVSGTGRIIYANSAALALLAPGSGSLQGQRTGTLWHPDPFDGTPPAPGLSQPLRVQLRAASGPRAALELTIARDGADPTYYLQARPQPADTGLPERLRTALALSTDAAMVVDARTLAFLDVNPAARALMGKDRAAVLASGPIPLRRRDGSHVEDFHRLYADLIDHAPQAVTIEYDFTAADGRIIPISATRQALSVDGRWLIFVTWRDISERVAAQVQVQQLKDAFDQTADAINIVDIDSLGYVYVNEAFARMLALPREQVMARGPLAMPRETVIVDDLREYLASLVAQHPSTVVRETLTTLPDGSQQVIESHHHAFFSGGRWLARSTRADITQRKRQQRHLQRILAAFDASGDGIYIIDPRTFEYVDVNEAAARLHGVTREELRAMGVRGAFPGRFDEAGLRARYDELIALHPHSLTEDRQIPRRDGAVVWAESIRRAIQVDGDWLVISVMRDITQRRAAQARMELFAAAVSLSADAVLVIRRHDMRIVEVNDAACRMYRHSREDLLALPPHSNKVGGTADNLTALYDETIRASPAISRADITAIRSDGTQFPAEAQRCAIQVNGEWIVVITVRDLTQQKDAQARQALLTAAIEAAPDGIAVVDPDTLQYIHANEAACRTHGVSREELMARGVDGMFSGQMSAADIRALYANVIRSHPQAITEERVIVADDGTAVAYEAVRRAVRVDNRWLIISMNRDISERKAAQARLELMHQAINAAPDAIVVIDPTTLEYIDVNEAALQLYGLSRQELMSRGARKGLSGRSSDEEMRAFYASIVEQAPRALVEERDARLNGRDVTLEFTRRAVNVGGRWLIVSVNRNITARKVAEAGLNQLKAVVDVAPDGMYIVDPYQQEYVTLNHAAGQLYGLTREQVLDMGMAGFMSWLNESDPGFSLRAVRERHLWLIDNYPQTHAAQRRVRLPGRPELVTETLRQAVQVDGRWLILIVVRDITEREAARARSERFAAIANLSADAVLVFDRARMAIVDVNETACRMYGYTHDEFLALAPHAGRTGATADELARQYDAVIAASPQVLQGEITAVRKDGSTFPGEVHRQALRSGDGWLVVATVRDITERKQAENEIRRRVAELELLREAYDAASDAIMIADPDTLGYYDVNNAAVHLLGVSREELLRRGVEASYYSTAGEAFEPERFRKGSRYVISRAPQAVVDVRTVKPLGLGGRDTVIEFSRRGVNINGRWVIVTIMRDITAARQAEEEIRQRVAELTRSNQELEQFAYVTSHDLSEPLRMVASYTQLLARRYADKFDDDGREFIKYAVDGAQRMKQLIDDLLMYSRAGRHNVQMRPMRMDRALDDALANLANAVERTGATIERDPLPELVCEKAGLTQVFQNLVGNALKFRGDAAPVVRISAAEGEHFWTISVTDNGIGIAPEYFQRIFIIFQRLHSRTKYEGTGIGLSICKKIVERHGGQISVTSEPGLGTTFSFTLSKSLTESEPS